MKKSKVNIANLTLCALLTAISTIFILLNYYVGVFSFVLIFGLPLISCLGCLKLDIKYTLIYFISTILLCSIIDFQSTLFYLIPEIICGVSFSILIKNKVHSLFILIVVSVLDMCLEIGSFFLIQGLYSTNILEFFQNLLELDNQQFHDRFPAILLGISFIKMSITYLIIIPESEKFKYSINNTPLRNWITFSSLVLFTISSSVAGIIYPPAGYLLSIISLILSVYTIYIILKKNILPINISLICIYVLTFFVFLGTCNYLPNYSYIFNYFAIATALINVILIIYSLCKKKKENSPLEVNIEEEKGNTN